MEPYDPEGPLPTGTTLLEASAGTGKTHTIATMVARHVVAGTPFPAILLLTFTRKAARELRDRVRERLTHTLAGTDPAGVAAGRLRDALADFDAATIGTIHEFCGASLADLGLLATDAPAGRLLPDPSRLLTQVSDDVWWRMFGEVTHPGLDRAAAADLVRAVAGNREVPIVPDPAGSPVAAARVEFAARARREFLNRLRREGWRTHDDLIEDLARVLADAVSGPPARDRLRRRYRVVMVDEFQDTDPRQWAILRSAFAGHADLVLIGDPKQAIYSFRGGDVETYLRAGSHADRVLTLTTNWRTDAGVLAGIDALFDGAALGSPRIRLRPTRARHGEARLTLPDGRPAAPVTLRVVPRAYERISPQRRRIIADLADQVTGLLGSGMRLEANTTSRPLRPHDIAVLVRTNRAAARVADGLVARAIPAVVTGSGSVLDSPAAAAWSDLLGTLVDPQPPAVRRLALGPFIGWDLDRLVRAEDDEIAELFVRVRRWARLWADRGVSAVLQAALGEADLAARTIRRTGSERLVTDLRHLGQLLHDAERTGDLAPQALADWLADQRRESSGRPDDARALRLETEAEAVQVLTVHGAKGLEFPVVLLPDAAEHPPSDRDEEAFVVHDPTGERQVDVGGRTDSSSRARRERALEERAGEDLRLLYVAMTRAACRLVLWWAPHRTYAAAASLHRLLCGVRGADGTVARRAPVPAADALVVPAGVTVETVGDAPEAVAPPSAPRVPGPLRARAFTREVDVEWRRTSYSGLTAGVHAAGPDPGTDEPDVDTPVPAAAAEPDPGPWQDLPVGTRFGTLVHAVLEAWDPGGDPLQVVVERTLTHHPVDGVDPGLLAAGLGDVVRTPLAGSLGGVRLADVAIGDRLSELSFELPLCGGDTPTGRAELADVAACLRDHLPHDDPLAGYPDLLAAPGLGEQVLRGFLTGSIDAVLRVGRERGPGFVVVDYKTNWLGAPRGSAPLSRAAYAPGPMAAAMMAAHYPLQALLYEVALHRYLTWRLPGYDPARHLAGVRYLFLRGMSPDTAPAGVFAWDPPAGLIVDLAALLGGEGSR